MVLYISVNTDSGRTFIDNNGKSYLPKTMLLLNEITASEFNEVAIKELNAVKNLLDLTL